MNVYRRGDLSARPYGTRRPRHRDRGGVSREPTRLSYTLVRIGVYLAVLPPILLIYGTKGRGLLMGSAIGLICAVATWYLLRDVPAPQWRRALYTAVVGLVLAELTWAFGHWGGVSIVGGAAIWLAFYVLSGIVEHGLANTLDRRIMLEYGVVALVGVLVVLASAPWRA
jgi:hypothetical protein